MGSRLALEQLLVKLPGSQKTLVATAGKQAIYEVLEGDTGRYLFSMDLGLQDVVTGIDAKTGAKTIDRAKTPETANRHGVARIRRAPSRGTRVLQRGHENAVRAAQRVVHGSGACGTRRPLHALHRRRWMLRPRLEERRQVWPPAGDRLQARKVAWTMRQRAPWTSECWQPPAGRVRRAASIACSRRSTMRRARALEGAAQRRAKHRADQFQVGGKAIHRVVGRQRRRMATSFPMLLPEVKNPRDNGAALYVFALADR